jgi:hypothetical protein
MAPVEHGMCRYESLINGQLTLVDIARMNDVLAVKFDNEAILAERSKNESR